MTYTEKRLEEFDEKFKDWCFNHHQHLGRMFHREPVQEYVKQFLSESIQQAVAEERERLVGEIEKIYSISDTEQDSCDNFKNKIIDCFSLDKPSIDKE